MKKLSLAALMFAVAGAAFADDITPDPYNAVPSVKTRAQVQAELAQAKADGSIKVWSTTYNPLKVARSVKTRDQVVAELNAARDSGEYAVLNSEDSGSSVLAQGPRKAALAPTLAQAR
ncbi:MAG: DUF4148 domain-containing protein [Pseudomonadota bacterium]